MGDIKEYILSHNIRRFMANLGLTEMITNKHGGQGPGKKEQTIRDRQLTVSVTHKAL